MIFAKNYQLIDLNEYMAIILFFSFFKDLMYLRESERAQMERERKKQAPW